MGLHFALDSGVNPPQNAAMNQLPSWLADIRQSVTVIGEVKTKSPFGWFAPAKWPGRREMLAALDASPDIDWISVHTDEKWGGSMEWLAEARDLTKKTILAKGFHCTKLDVQNAFNSGADWVLTVDWYGGKRCIPEFRDRRNLMSPWHAKAVWNARDPRTGDRNPMPFSRACKGYAGWLCQASMIGAAEDVHPRADAVLIGEALWR